MTSFLADTLIVIPLSEEWRSIRKVYEQGNNATTVRERQTATGNYYLWRWKSKFDRNVVATPVWLKTPGETKAGIHAARALDLWNPGQVALVGIAGSIDPERARLGDVIIPSDIYGYEVSAVDDAASGGWEEKLRATPHNPPLAGLFRVQAFRDSSDYGFWQEECLEAAAELGVDLKGRPPALHCDRAFASGNKVVRSQRFGELLKERINSSIVAVAMEGVGVDYAIEYSARFPRFLVIRGISDYADKDKSELERSSNDGWREFAAGNAARALRRIVDRDQEAPSCGPIVLDPVAADAEATLHFFENDYRAKVGAQHLYFENLIERGAPTPAFSLTLRAEYEEQEPKAEVRVRARIDTGGMTRWLEATAEASGWRIEVPRNMSPSRLDLGIGSLSQVSSVAFHLEDEFGRKARGKYALP